MKKTNLTLLISSIIILIISVLIWVDIFNQEQLIRNEKLSNIESACYEKLLFYIELIDAFAFHQGLTKDEFESFFCYKSVSYLQKVDSDDFEFMSVLKYSNGIDTIKYDEILQLKSTSIFFLFKENKFYKSIHGCKINPIFINTYFNSKGEYDTTED
ncbi:hypothetical protein [Tenuifilum thalassicum]|uniref:Uncharacterized protein n=1 Tax=Tenuifilum thalassicum TaxID=2590900 RepID=A0A7D4CSN2_9BACT|nr:hypothetical protein [Tenuifilum thalassicum]QKG80885.1 hypothetical protein FHG85_11635 [Tenuifilum thalassicum]